MTAFHCPGCGGKLGDYVDVQEDVRESPAMPEEGDNGVCSACGAPFVLTSWSKTSRTARRLTFSETLARMLVDPSFAAGVIGVAEVIKERRRRAN